MVATKLIFVFALCEMALAASPMIKVKPEDIELLHNHKGAFCLDEACVGLAGNQESFLGMTLGTVNEELENLPPTLHIAKHGMACHAGACAGVDNEDMPFIMFLGVDSNPETMPIGIEKTNGFICLESSCAHLHGNPDDSAHIMEKFNANGVHLVHAKVVGIYADKVLSILN